MFNNFPYFNVKSVRLGSHYITNGADPTYILSGPITVTEGDSVTILLTSTDVDSGEVVPYIITGVTTDDISGVSLNGEFVIGSVDSITLDVTEDINLEGYETLVLSLVNGEDSISITIDDGIISQLGQNILSLDAEDDDKYGIDVAINYDGSVIATSSALAGDANLKSGRVRVYQLSNNNWAQIGQDIDGENSGDYGGNSIDISDDGNIIVVSSHLNDGGSTNAGQVRIFRLVNNTWTQIGEDIYGEAAEDRLGIRVSINSDGSMVAISAPYNDIDSIDNDNYGHVRVYQNLNDTWTQLGQDIDGENVDDLLGWSLDINGGGTIIAIGTRNDDQVFDDAGKVTIYQIVGGSWVKVGQDIYGENQGDLSGHDVSLNDDGTIVAISAHRNDDNGSTSGHVKVYQINGSTWEQLGSNIIGEAAGDLSGTSVSLNAAGDIIAIGAPRNDDGGSSSGHTRIYVYNGSDWEQIGLDVNGTAISDWSGFSVDISSDGTRFIVGEPKNDDVADNAGRTRVFEIKQETPVVVSTYNLIADSSVNEGQQITFTLTTENVDQGTSINYTIIGISTDDIDGSSLIGSFVVGFIDSVTLNVTDDLLLEGNETISFILDNGGDSIDVVVNDGIVPIYQLSSDVINIDEGQSVTITLLTDNVQTGTSIPYTITGVSSDDISGAPLTGNFIVGTTDSVTLTVTEDALTEGNESLTFTLDNGEDDIDVIITDTSLTPIYNLTSNVTNIDEGQSVTISLLTENIQTGVNVPYTITGVSSDDIGGAPLTGNFVISETNVFPYSFPVTFDVSDNIINFNITEDFITEGVEIFTLTLDNVGDFIDVTINDTSVETYNLSGPTTVNEGDIIVINLTTQGVVSGTSVPYTITGVSSDDINGEPLTGNFIVGTTDSVTLNVTEDALTEGNESLTFTLDNGEDDIDVIIVDTSRDPIFNLSGPSIVNEGGSIIINLVTENVVNGVNVPYTITGVSSDDISGASLTGNFIVGTTDSVTLNVTEDALTEGNESLTFTLDNGEDNIDVIIVDTSRDPIFNLSGPTTVNEGDNIVIQLVTENVVNGVNVPYTITGISSDDISGASLTGNFIVGTTDSITLNVTEDALTEGNESLTFTLDNGEDDIDVIITDTSLAPTYTLTSDVDVVSEGQIVTITLDSENVSDGTLIPYTITGDGITSSELGLNSLSGNFGVNSTDTFPYTFPVPFGLYGNKIIITVSNDFITEGVETFNLTLDNGEDSIDVTITDTSVETYNLSGPTTVNEGDNIVINLTTQGVVSGTSVPYTITGISSDDIGGAPLTGNFVVGTTDSVTLNVTEDALTEGNESLTFTLDNGEDDIDVIITDTSLAPIYTLSGPTTVTEGDNIVIQLVTENIVNGVNIPYTITGISSDDIGGAPLTGNFVVGTTDSVTLNVTEDALTEGNESLTFTLDNGEDDIDVIITDTSLDPTYTLSGPTTVNEGDNIVIQLDTTDVFIGTSIPYTITGVSSDDISGAPLTGNFVVGTTDSVTLNVTEDALTEGNESLTFTLDNGEDDIDVIITDTSLDPTYNLSGPTTVTEGDNIVIQLVTENIVNGVNIPYTITGVSSDDISGAPLTGNFVVGTTDSVTLNVTEDALTEGNESLTFTLDNGEDDIDVIITDTSLAPTYNLTSDPESVIRGESLNITLGTENVSDGDILNFTITGDVVATDLGLSSLTGAFTINNNVSQLSLNISGDINVSKTFTLSLDDVGENISVDVTINLGDMFAYTFPITLVQ